MEGMEGREKEGKGRKRGRQGGKQGRDGGMKKGGKTRKGKKLIKGRDEPMDG
jgi:hypothetical protein